MRLCFQFFWIKIIKKKKKTSTIQSCQRSSTHQSGCVCVYLSAPVSKSSLSQACSLVLSNVLQMILLLSAFNRSKFEFISLSRREESYSTFLSPLCRKISRALVQSRALPQARAGQSSRSPGPRPLAQCGDVASPQLAQDSFNNVHFVSNVLNAVSISSGSYEFPLTGKIK